MVQTKIFAHRGFSGKYPENTMAAFKEAAAVGADGIELDVQLTKDGVPVIIHDHYVDRVTDGKGHVRSFTLTEIQRFPMKKDANEYIPTLEEYLQWTSENDLLLNLELKTVLADRSLITELILPLLQRYQVEERTILSSFDHKALAMAKQKKPHIEAAALVHQAMVKPGDYLKLLNVEGLHFKSDTLQMDEAKELHSFGVSLRPYTVNKRDEMLKFMTWGCEGIFTDYPDLALQVRDQEISAT